MGINKRNSRQENLPFDRKRTLVAINTHDEPIRTGLVTSTNRFIIGRHKRDSLPLGLGHTSVRVEEEPAVRTFWGRKCCVAKQRNPGMKSHKSCLIRTEDGAGSFVWLRSAHNSSCWESWITSVSSTLDFSRNSMQEKQKQVGTIFLCLRFIKLQENKMQICGFVLYGYYDDNENAQTQE